MAAMNKRKRDAQEIVGNRPAPGTSQIGNTFEQHYLQKDQEALANTDATMDFATAFGQHAAGNTGAQTSGQMHMTDDSGANASDTAAAAMAYHTMTIPQSTESAFLHQKTDFNASSHPQQRASSLDELDNSAAQTSPNGDGSPTLAMSMPGYNSTPKPAVGSEEWHKVRKDNHKEVERRRRETINEGINELAKIVPGCEKNKGSILARAVQFITQLKENETQNIEKWTLEKLLTEQAIAELGSSCDKLKEECQRAWAECEQWKKAAQKAGVTIDAEDKEDDEDGD